MEGCVFCILTEAPFSAQSSARVSTRKSAGPGNVQRDCTKCLRCSHLWVAAGAAGMGCAESLFSFIVRAFILVGRTVFYHIVHCSTI